jgi:1-acyl-sn-glycerol-3-phosphate acyltransferase
MNMSVRWRMLRMTLHLVQGLATCAFVFPLVSSVRRDRHIKSWSRKLLTLCRVRLQCRTGNDIPDHAPDGNAILICNHVSWLDVFVINAIQPTRFVAKSEIRHWPFIGWLCQQTGTIFIDRTKPRDVLRILNGLDAEMARGEHIGFFPEGRTAPLGQLLPFYSNLFEAAANSGAPLQPYVVRYMDIDGRPNEAAEFIGDMTFVESLGRIMRGQPLVVELSSLPRISSQGKDRRELAKVARQRMAVALELSSEIEATAE